MKHTESRCLNCRQLLLMNQRFCHQCGQKTDTHRINFHFLVHEVPHSIFHVDNGILFTLKELFTRPGHSIREYLEGKRQQHFKPVMLVLIMGSLCALTQFLLNSKPKAETEVFKGDISGTNITKYIDFNGFISYFRHIVDWLGSHLAFTVLLMLPIAAFGFYLGFRKYKLNYPEWFVIFLFLAGQSLTVYILFIFLNRFAGNFNPLFFLVCLGLVIFSLIQLFEERGRKYVILRALWATVLTYFFGLIYLLLSIIIVAAIGLMMYGYGNIITELQNGKL